MRQTSIFACAPAIEVTRRTCVERVDEGTTIDVSVNHEALRLLQALATRVRSCLEQTRVSFIEDVKEIESVPVSVFTITPARGSHLKVTLYADDPFSITANEALVMISSGSADGAEDLDWINECERVLRAVLSTDLRFRVTRSRLWGSVGQIWVPYESGGVWCGNLRAARGKEQVFTYPWFEVHGPTNSSG